jgi:hypothetical protein
VADWDQFDYAFTCPPGIDGDLTLGYEKVLNQVRTECAGLDMSTAAVLRVSVLVGWYIKHMHTSRRPYGEDSGYSTPAMEKNAVQAWSVVAAEHDAYVQQLRSKARNTTSVVPTEDVANMVKTVLSKVTDPAQRADLQDKFIEEMERVGI